MNPFQLIETGIDGCYEIRPRVFEDSRGRFIKMFNRKLFGELGLNSNYEESYYSVSSARVLRGLHFQIPPKSHIKLVSCLKGSILDVVYDLRSNSTSAGQVYSLELNSETGNMLYVPEGLAHGFYVNNDKAIFLSLNSRKFSPECDCGIRWDSIPFQWPDPDPVISEKDRDMISLKDFKNPYLYEDEDQ